MASILIVDDDQDVREILAQLLEDEGYAVASASNGREALDKLQTLPRPVLMILDLMMPVMSGWEVMDELRREGRKGAVRVAVASAVPNPEVPDADAVLRKPIDLDNLLDTVARLLKQG
ncbi:MAG: response regulator [Myxococcales bacterium]